jgi:hypothetical protein
MKQFYSVLTAIAVFLTSSLSAQTVSENFETPANMTAMLGNCWVFNNVTYTSATPITGTGSVVTQLGSVSQMVSPDLVIPSSLTINFSYNTIVTQSGSKTLKVLLVINGVETLLESINLNSSLSGTLSQTYTNANTPGNNINGIRKIIFRTTANAQVVLDNLNINAPLANPGACQASPLPVKLVSFQGALNKNKVQLTWLIAENETAKSFEVQRSTNGTDFSTATVITASSKSGDENYSYTETVSSPRVLYRLKMYDVDSKAEYSRTLVFNSSNILARSLQVLTNPVKDKLVISFTNETAEVAQVNIYDNVGRVMQKQSLTASQGINTNTISLNGNYRSGMYIVELVTKAGKLAEKVIYSNQ